MSDEETPFYSSIWDLLGIPRCARNDHKLDFSAACSGGHVINSKDAALKGGAAKSSQISVSTHTL
jgi:hypothetical protein